MVKRRKGGESAYQMFTRQAREGQKLRQSRDRGGHRGGFNDPVHGSLDGRLVTAAFGWGGKEGHTELVDGHVDLASFWQRSDRNHYGPGDGPNGNVKERFGYTGSGS